MNALSIDRAIRRAVVFLILSGGASTLLAQQGNERQSEAYRASVAQETLKDNTAAVQAQLAEVAEAMRQLLPNEVGTVDRALKAMNNLSHDEMATTIQALRDASRSPDHAAQLTKLASALKDQAKISSTLRQLAIDLNARQSIEGISAELSALVRRQVKAQAEISRLGQVQPAPDHLRNEHRRRYEAANDDQKGITQDVVSFTSRLDDLARSLPDEAKARLGRAAVVARDRKLIETEQNAAKLTNDGPLPNAADLQNQCATTLVQMEQAFALDPAAHLSGLSGELKNIVEQQKDLTAKITELSEHERTSVPDQLKRAAEGLGDQAAAVRTELQPLNATAANALQQAQEKIDKALENYKHMWEQRADARANTQSALAAMQTAAQAVDQQAAQAGTAANAAAKTPAEAASELAQLLRETQQAAAIQARYQPSGAPPFSITPEQHQALTQKVGELQQRALPIVPDASTALGNAAGEMPKQTADAQRAATNALNEAVRLLSEKQNAMNGQSPAQQALAKAQEQVAQAAQTAAQAQKDMANQNTMSQAFTEAGAAQQQMAAAAQAAAQAGAPDEAKADLQKAQQAMAEAQKGAAQGKAAEAQAAAQQAQQGMAQAQAAMGGAIQAIAQQAAGGPAMASQQGNGVSQQEDGTGGTPDSRGNGGGGKSGDFLAGAGAAGGPAQVVNGLSPHDRDAIAQLQNEKPPAEYVSEVQQYYKNIADAVVPGKN